MPEIIDIRSDLMSRIELLATLTLYCLILLSVELPHTTSIIALRIWLLWPLMVSCGLSIS
jgi:hypothetical protein